MAEYGYPILNKLKDLEAKLNSIEAHLNSIDSKLDEIKRNQS